MAVLGIELKDALPYLVTAFGTIVVAIAYSIRTGSTSLTKFQDALQVSHQKLQGSLEEKNDQLRQNLERQLAEEKAERSQLSNQLDSERTARGSLEDRMRTLEAQMNQVLGEKRMLDAKNLELQDRLGQANHRIGVLENEQAVLQAKLTTAQTDKALRDQQFGDLDKLLKTTQEELRTAIAERDRIAREKDVLERKLNTFTSPPTPLPSHPQPADGVQASTSKAVEQPHPQPHQASTSKHGEGS